MHFLTEEQELTFNSPIQALYFYAPWMPFHKKMLIMINKVQEKHKDIVFFAIDVDPFKNLCKRFNISSIPTVIIMKDAVELKRINGLAMTSAFKSAFSDI